MRLLAILLLCLCSIDIVIPLIKVVQGITIARRERIKIDKELRSIFILIFGNCLALIFFISFLIKY